MQGKFTQFLTIFSFFVAISLLFSTNIAKSQDSVFSRPLKFGMSGEDVRNLQKILNLSQETAIQGLGSGSPGKESTYFGSLTRDAVIRFQEKYKNEILKPNGLSSGTGFVGPSTIAMLVEIGEKTAVVPAGAVISNFTVTDAAATSSLVSPENPNQKNLNIILAAIERVGREQGISDEKISMAKQIVIAEAATTTDLNKKFIDAVEKAISSAPVQTRSTLSKIWEPLRIALFGRKAEAAIATPFGGRLLFSMYCTQSQNWWIGVQPLPPSYATLLTYQTGTQIHLGYNIPLTTQLLGQYSFGAPCIQGVCPFCVTMPSQGMILPNVGSSSI